MKRLSSHAHVIKILASYICDRELIIQMSPAASDGDLGAYLARIFESGMENEQEATLNRAFGCLASGLVFMHKHTIRHKDIKPQNILIHKGRVVYTDFGISFDADDQDTTTVGYPGAFTKRYCAPEVQDHTSRNRKSDVYSLGCVFVEILDVLEPKIGLRVMDELPYFGKTDELMRRLVQSSVTGRPGKGLLRICHDMLEPNPIDRIDSSGVLLRISSLHSPQNNLATGHFCDDCLATSEWKDIAIQENPGEDCTALSIHDTTIDVAPLEANIQNTSMKNVKRHKKKKPTSNIGFGAGNELTVSQNAFTPEIPRYYCTTCGESGHVHSKCPNDCWACGELYHKSADCPNKCWTCDFVGHYARDCPNECDACGQIGHPTDDCPNKCWTCDEIGHFARDCQDRCFVCGRQGHSTWKCKGKCHKCGMVGHWRKDCDDACFECKSLLCRESSVLTRDIHRW
jgi:serine/threonine protein kinase